MINATDAVFDVEVGTIIRFVALLLNRRKLDRRQGQILFTIMQFNYSKT